MSKSYLLVYKTKNVLNSNISKIFIFKTAELAYEYAIDNDFYGRKEIFNSLEDAIQQKIIWKTSNGLPTSMCKIIEIDTELLLEVYGLSSKEPNLVHFIYKHLKLFNKI